MAVRRIVLAACWIFLSSAVHAGGAVDQLHQFLASTRTLKAEFSQLVVARNAKKPQQSSGVVMISRPGKLRWEIQKPYPQTLVGDGEKIWIHDHELAQVTVRKAAKALGSSPAALLAGNNDLERNFDLREGGESEGMNWVEALPKSQDSGFEKLRLGFAGSELRGMTLYDNFGQVTHIRFARNRTESGLAPEHLQVYSAGRGRCDRGINKNDPHASMQIVIVSPALADANNGNWRTAHRWTRFLQADGQVRVATHWPDRFSNQDDVMLALHARRSASAINAWYQARGSRGLGVVLTGTDLHGDIHHSPEAVQSLHSAQALVVLHERGIACLPQAVRAKARVILQSAGTRQQLKKTKRHLNVLVVGHLRHEKSPETIFAAARLLRDVPDIRIVHVGDALDPALAQEARMTMQECRAYNWRGGLPHATVRQLIQRAHVLVHPSRMEGGANVVIEAMTSRTPVLASAVDGNIGLLGEDYPGYFAWGDADALVRMLLRLRGEQAETDELAKTLLLAVAGSVGRFHPDCERKAIRRLVADLME